MGQSFFSRFKSALSQDYGGRYFAVVLREVILENPKVFLKALFPAANQYRNSNKIAVHLEFQFSTNENIRKRADLAVEINGKIVGLIEIKYEDHKSTGNPAQWSEYLAYCKRHRCHFAYVTQHSPMNEIVAGVEKFERGKVLFYRNLHEHIKNKNIGPVGILFKNYLEEDFMIYNDCFLRSQALHLVLRSIWPRHAHGFGRQMRKSNTQDAGSFLTQLLMNMRVLSDEMYSDVGEFFGNSPQVDFHVEPTFNIPKLRKALGEKDADYDCLQRGIKSGGYFVISAQAKFKDVTPYLYMNLYLTLELDLKEKGQRQGFGISQSVGIKSGKISAEFEDGYSRIEWKPNRAQIHLPQSAVSLQFKELARESISQALLESSLPKTSRQVLMKFDYTLEQLLA